MSIQTPRDLFGEAKMQTKEEIIQGLTDLVEAQKHEINILKQNVTTLKGCMRGLMTPHEVNQLLK